MLLGAGALRRAELAPQLSARRLAALAAVVGLLVALLLPWARYVFAPSATALGIAAPAAAVVAVSSVWLLGLSWQADAGRRGQRLAVAAVAELFTGAALSSLTVLTTPVWGMWVGLAAACAIVVLVSTDGIRIPRTELPQWVAIASCASAALLVVSLFLPWQRECDASIRCVSTNGWTTELGVAIAVLALGVVVLTLVWSRPGAPVAALVAGVGLLVATLGFQLQDLSGAGFRLTFGYGSTVGFVAGGLLLVLAVPRSYPASVDRSRMLFRLGPMLACVAYLAFVLVPRWGVLPLGLQRQLRFAPISWLTISGALLAVWLLREWAGRVAADSENSERLVMLPLALLSLAALDLIRLRAVGITWGGGAVVVLCLLLAMLGRVEQRGGLETFRMPEILRVDRL